MIPEFSHCETYEKQSFWVTTDGSIGTGFIITGVDLEVQSNEEYLTRLRLCLKQISPSVLVRIKLLRSEECKLDSLFPRAEAINRLGFNKTSIFIHFEVIESVPKLITTFIATKRDALNVKRKKSIIEAANLFRQQGFSMLPLSEAYIRSQFHKSISNWRTSLKSIETGSEQIGLVRLGKMPFKEFCLQDWLAVINALPVPYSFHVSFQRYDEARAKLFLEKRLKQYSSGKDVSSKAQETAAANVILESMQTGSQLFDVEVLVELKRRNEVTLSEVLDSTRAKLSLFGESVIETFGVAPTFCATLLGNYQHVTFIESEEGLSGILPILSQSESESFNGEPARTLSLFRSEGGLCHFDLFNPEFNVFNSLIIGTSGKGKSVLLGLMTSSLLNDPKVRIIKLDVGGSHSKECELFGGVEYQLTLEKGSGINPFSVILTEASDSDKVAILSKFLGSLVLEQGELVLSKAIRSDIENSLQNYLETSPTEPSLEGFYKFAKNFPRKELLRRWTTGGVYEKAFKASDVKSKAKPQLQYYNFSQIFQASDPEFAQAGVAAVLAQFNSDMLQNDGSRLVLICDEVPFFIKSCFEFFKFSTANVRKFGHACVLSGQLSTDFIVNGDTGIIENSPQRFLFSVDGDEKQYQKRFGLSHSQLNSIKELSSVVGVYSEALLQTGEAARKVVIRVTPEEYWRLTTSRTDKEKLLNLLEAVPGLSLREAINCLSVID